MFAKAVDRWRRISLIYKNETRANHGFDCLPMTGNILRGSLLTRTIRNHAKGCAKCARGEGHQLSVLTVSYPGGRTRQPATRTRCRSTPVDRQLSEAEGSDRSHLRTQS